MEPIKFKEQTGKLLKPGSMTDEECVPLPIWTDGKECISCWRPSIQERLSVLFFGRIWLSVFSGKTQPPVWVSCEKSVFKPARNQEEKVDD